MKKRLLLIILSAFLVLAGCSAKSNDKSKADSKAEDSSKSNASLVLPIAKNTSGKVQIQTVSSSPIYLYTSYVISSKEGENVVVDPTSMPNKKTVELNPAAIVSTHLHPDHYDPVYYDAYTCKTFSGTKDDIKTKDFHIYSTLSSHSGDEINPNDPNVIIIFEVDGLRIAHMGDIGQTKLTDEQLKALGQIDIAFMQFDNSYSDMSIDNQKGFKLIEQLNPKIVIPTHYPDSAIPVFESRYGKVTEVNNVLQISKEDIPSKPLQFYRITNTHTYN